MSAPPSMRPATSSLMPETLEQAPAELKSDRAGFRLAAFGAAIVVVLFAGYGIGRLNNSVEQAQSVPAATSDGHGDHGAAAAPPHDDSGAAPHQHNADGTVTHVSGSGAAAESVG